MGNGVFVLVLTVSVTAFLLTKDSVPTKLGRGRMAMRVRAIGYPILPPWILNHKLYEINFEKYSLVIMICVLFFSPYSRMGKVDIWTIGKDSEWFS